MPVYLYRCGNGNEGNYPIEHVMLNPGDDPDAALLALVANRFICGTRARRYVIQWANTDRASDSVELIVFEGPDGQTEFGAAWLTAELEILNEDDLPDTLPHHFSFYLDDAAKLLYRRRRVRQVSPQDKAYADLHKAHQVRIARSVLED